MENARLKELREKYNITQEKLAEEVGVSQSMISHIEAGRKEPRKMTKFRIVNFFNEHYKANITVEWLFYEQIDDLKSYLKADNVKSKAV